MTERTHIAYLFDPLCGWCYGAAPVLAQLASRDGFEVKLVPTGLFSGAGARRMDKSFAAYAWSNDQRIAQLSGQRFTEAYRGKVLGKSGGALDSGPATIALTAVALTSPSRQLEALRLIQEARYVAGRDVTYMQEIIEILNGSGLEAAAGRLAAADEELLAATRKRTEAARMEMRRFGAGGVPALIVGVGEGRRVLPASNLFGPVEDLVAGLKAA
jgi:putative protein-disulfide isomerase